MNLIPKRPYPAVSSGHVLVVVLQDITQFLLLQQFGQAVAVLEHGLALFANYFLLFRFDLLGRAVGLVFCFPLSDGVSGETFRTGERG